MMATGPFGERWGCQVNCPGLRFLPSTLGAGAALRPPLLLRRAARAAPAGRRLAKARIAGLDAQRLGPRQAPERRLDDAADHCVVTDAGLERGSGKARVIAETGVRIDFQDEGRVRPIDAEIDPRVTVDRAD